MLAESENTESMICEGQHNTIFNFVLVKHRRQILQVKWDSCKKLHNVSTVPQYRKIGHVNWRTPIEETTNL